MILCKIIHVVTQRITLQAQIAQLVEQRTENPRVTGSIPVLGIIAGGCHATECVNIYAGVVQW